MLSMNESNENEISDNKINSGEPIDVYDNSKSPEHELKIEDINMFEEKEKHSEETENNEKYIDCTEAEIHDLQQNKKYEEIFTRKKSPSGDSISSVNSVTSLRSMDAVPSFLGKGGIKKWDNVQNLEDTSLDSSMIKSEWAVVESDAGMFRFFNTCTE